MPAQADTISVGTDEERAVRDAVAAIAGSFGPDYYQQQVDEGANCAELWDALGANGYLGVHLPDGYGGGGLGMREIAIVVQETAVAGCPLQAMLFSAGVTGTILDRSASDEQKARWLPGIATGETRLSF
jgi:alkylation response protein AidB-like acyl-CoA dehydrogenase